VLDPVSLAVFGQRQLPRIVANGVGDRALEGRGDRPSKLVVARRFGRNATPSGVVIVAGTETSTQAMAPPRSRPAELMARSSSRRLATVVSNHWSYWCIW